MFSIPARGLIGLRTRLLNATQGTAVIHHRFESYAPAGRRHSRAAERRAGLDGLRPRRTPTRLDTLQERSELFVAPGDEVYEGMIVGENARDEDMSVNPTKEKKLTNMRATGTDKNILLKPPRIMSLEMALEYIEEDELRRSHADARSACARRSSKKPTAAASRGKVPDEPLPPRAN